MLYMWLLDSLGVMLSPVFQNRTVTEGKPVPSQYKRQQRELCQVQENNYLPFNCLKKSGVHGEWEAAQRSNIQMRAN